MSNELALAETVTAISVFRQENGVESILNKIKEQAKSLVLDASTETGRKEIASAAYKIARSKTALDDMGKQLVEADKARIKEVDNARKIIRDELDALKDEIRKPLTDFENAEKARIEGHEAAIADIEIKAQSIFDGWQTLPIEQIKFDAPERDWQEFKAKAIAVMDRAQEKIKEALTKRQKYDAEQAELARLREAEAARVMAEREAKIAFEAAEKARIEAESKAAAEAKALQDMADKEKKEALAQIEAARIAKEQAEKAAKEADERAAKAAENERLRIEQDAKAESDRQQQRQADVEHRGKINREALSAVMSLGITEQQGMAIITAIAKGAIPHVKINY